jgi:hypothetical protein
MHEFSTQYPQARTMPEELKMNRGFRIAKNNIAAAEN